MIEIFQALVVFGVAFLVAYLAVPFSKRIAVKIGAVDYPGNRRVNNIPVPRCGGIALYAGLVAACFVMLIGRHFFDWQVYHLFEINEINFLLLAMGVSFIFIVGLIDDVIQLTPVVKFGGQIVACIIVALSGITIGIVRSPFESGFVDLGWLDIPITVIYLLIFVNTVNLIDGLDGLAAGIVVIVCTGLLYLMISRGGSLFILIAVALIAVCLAFLRFNFYPASVFMGDSGSLLLGLMVGVISIAGVVRTQSLVVMLVPLVMAGVPMLDTVSAIIRRLRGHQPVQQADMGHIHHRLFNAGFGQRKSVLILYTCSAVLAFIGCLLGTVNTVMGQWIVVAVLAVGLFIVIWRFGLFSPVLKHYFDHKSGRGSRTPPETEIIEVEPRKKDD